MTFVVVRNTLDVAAAHGQHGLRTLQLLALTLRVRADQPNGLSFQ
jgi:hypothetical protein